MRYHYPAVGQNLIQSAQASREAAARSLFRRTLGVPIQTPPPVYTRPSPPVTEGLAPSQYGYVVTRDGGPLAVLDGPQGEVLQTLPNGSYVVTTPVTESEVSALGFDPAVARGWLHIQQVALQEGSAVPVAAGPLGYANAETFTLSADTISEPVPEVEVMEPMPEVEVMPDGTVVPPSPAEPAPSGPYAPPQAGPIATGPGMPIKAEEKKSVLSNVVEFAILTSPAWALLIAIRLMEPKQA